MLDFIKTNNNWLSLKNQILQKPILPKWTLFTFIYLQKTFIKAPIFHHFKQQCFIWIETDALTYVIIKLFSQITLDQLYLSHMTHKSLNFSKFEDISQWHLVVFFSKKMIVVETWYKTYNQKLLGIVWAFKTWCHYLDKCKVEFLIFIDYNKLWKFIDTKNLSSKQVR